MSVVLTLNLTADRHPRVTQTDGRRLQTRYVISTGIEIEGDGARVPRYMADPGRVNHHRAGATIRHREVRTNVCPSLSKRS